MKSKRFISMILAVLTILSCMTVMSVSAKEWTNEGVEFFYYVDKDNNVSIEDIYSKEKEMVIPSTIEGYKVKGINIRALGQNKYLESLTVSEGVEYIDDGVFEKCKNLKSVSLPESLTEIGKQAFDGCVSLTEIKIPSKLKKLGKAAFRKTSITTVKIPKTLTTFENAVFANTKIENVTIPKNIKKIKGNPYSGCQNLKAFKVASASKAFSAKNGVLFNKKKTAILCYPSGKANTKYTVGSKVKKIGKTAFQGAKNLKNISFKKGIKEIKEMAFKKSSLISVKLPKSLKSIRDEAFEDCDMLKKVSIPSSVTFIGNRAFANNDSLSEINFKGNSKLVMVEGVFECNPSLKKISLPVCKEREGRLCRGCVNLKKVKISNKINRIYYEDFYDCNNLLSVTIPKSVKKIETRAFGYLTPYGEDDDVSYCMSGIVIRGYKNSAAQKYAKYSFKFVAIK